jgi:hypothetical protein
VSRAAAAVRGRALGVPPWVWLALLVVVSAVVRAVLARRIVAPWIMIDELIYSELAKSFAANGHFLVRGVPSSGYGFVYPVLIAPAWRLFAGIPAAYNLAKTINAVAMSLTAVPAYFLARRLVAAPAALAAALLTVLVPSMLYTGMLMTENAFYPIFVCFCLTLVRALENPTPRLQLGVLALCGVAYATRAQAVALVPAIVVAPLLLGVIERNVRGVARSFALTYGILVGGAVLAVAGTVLRGRSPLALLGAYRAATNAGYSTQEVAKFLLWHVAELDLYLGVIPFAALLVLWLSARSLSPAGRAFAAASLPVCVFLITEVAAFATQPSVQRIEERNMFYVAPLALIALFAVAGRLVPSRRAVIAVACVVAAVLPLTFPFVRFIGTSAQADTFGLLPWWWLIDHGLQPHDVRFAAFAAAAIAAALFAVLRTRLFIALPILVGVAFVLTSVNVDNGPRGIHLNSVGSLWAGIRVAHRNWIDRAVGHDADVSILWLGRGDVHVVWENEFFSRSVHTIYDLNGATPGDLPETAVHEVQGGRLADSTGRVVRAQYALADQAADVEGKVVASDPLQGLSLVRVNGPLVLQTHVSGVFADSWSGRQAGYTRFDCTGGKLSVLLQSDPHLYSSDQVVTATTGGQVLGVKHVPPIGERRLTVPLRPNAGHVCRVVFTSAQVHSPAGVVAGSTDTRKLGTRFLNFEYRP